MLSVLGLTAIETLALAKALDEKEGSEARNEVEPGVYDIDTVLHLKGRLSVAPATFANNPNKLDLWTLIAVLADRLRPETFETIVTDLCERQAQGDSLFDEKQIEALKKNTQEQMKKLLGTTRAERRGPVQFEGLVELAAGKSKKKSKPVELLKPVTFQKQA